MTEAIGNEQGGVQGLGEAQMAALLAERGYLVISPEGLAGLLSDEATQFLHGFIRGYAGKRHMPALEARVQQRAWEQRHGFPDDALPLVRLALIEQAIESDHEAALNVVDDRAAGGKR